MATVVLDKVNKVYENGFHAVHDLDIDIKDGEFLVLVGPSGCGKSTALRMIAGLESISSGTLTIGDRVVNDVHPKDRDIAFVFQNYALYPHMTVRDNIGFALKLRKTPRQEIEERVNEAARLLELTEYLDRKPGQLSGGQRQRVAVARAIVVDADVLLMDEPLSNLDALLRLSFRAELKKLVEEIGTTTIYVTHDQVEALSLGDRVAVMREGQVVQCDDPIAVYDRPASRFVGGFLGSPPMNFLAGTVDGASQPGEVTVDLGGQAVPVPAALTGLRGRSVQVGVRAETIEVSREELPGALQANVEVFEPLGSAVLITAELGGQQLKVQAPSTFRAAPGDTVWLTLRPEHLRWYDADTALALETA